MYLKMQPARFWEMQSLNVTEIISSIFCENVCVICVVMIYPWNIRMSSTQKIQTLGNTEVVIASADGKSVLSSALVDLTELYYIV